jgi:hypothetical protein
MPQQYLLAQGSIFIDVPPNYCQPFLDLAPDERAEVGEQFMLALQGGDAEERSELFDDLHDSEFRSVVAVDADGQPDIDDLREAANQLIEAYNSRDLEFDLQFELLGVGETPTCIRWIYDPDTGTYFAIYNWGLTVKAGQVAGEDFNWLPLSDARQRPGFALPEELEFMMDGSEIVVDLRYHLTVTIAAE